MASFSNFRLYLCTTSEIPVKYYSLHVTPQKTKPSKLKSKFRGLSPRANYTDRAAAAGRRS
jgi:hypothetical protein